MNRKFSVCSFWYSVACSIEEYGILRSHSKSYIRTEFGLEYVEKTMCHVKCLVKILCIHRCIVVGTVATRFMFTLARVTCVVLPYILGQIASDNNRSMVIKFQSQFGCSWFRVLWVIKITHVLTILLPICTSNRVGEQVDDVNIEIHV